LDAIKERGDTRVPDYASHLEHDKEHLYR